MNDQALVAAMVRGDPRGLEGAYRQYADRLLAYCRAQLHDADAAADALHDTFVAAGLHAGKLRDPDRLRAWLYAIARNECRRQLRSRSRQVPIEEAGEMSAPVDNPDAAVFAGQVREVVWAAAQGLTEGDREVFELMLRHGLKAADVGAVLGVSADHAHARMSRSRAQLERSLGALLVARTGAADCTDLAGLLRGWDGRLTPLLRKRIARHVESCSTCTERRRTQLTPAALLSAYAGLPFLAAPVELWKRINHTMAHPSQAAARQSIGDRTAQFDRGTGFPRPAEAVRRTRNLVTAALAIVLIIGSVAVLLVIGDTLRRAGADPRALAVAGPSVSAPRSASPPWSPSGSVSAPSPSTPPAPPSTPPAPPTTGRPPPAPVPFVVSAEGTVLCTTGTSVLRRFTLDVEATSRGGRFTTSTLHWSMPGTSASENAMAVSGSTAQLQVDELTGETITWWVAGTASGGRRDRTNAVTVANPCP
jgi:RNA polymerase sigma factor (sigma-70 family)